MKFDEVHEFTKEFKKLHKKYKSLGEDLKTFKTILTHSPQENITKRFSKITENEDIKINKVRLSCRYLKGSALRIVYALHKEETVFIEIFYKRDKENENYSRIKEYIKTF